MTSTVGEHDSDPGEFRAEAAKGSKGTAVPGEVVPGPDDKPDEATKPGAKGGELSPLRPGGPPVAYDPDHPTFLDDLDDDLDDDFDYSSVKGDDAIVILGDVLSNIPPNESRLTYDSAMLTMRSMIERDVAETLKEHPKAIFSIPNEIPPVEVSHVAALARTTMPKRNDDAVLDLIRTVESEDDPFADRGLPARGAESASK